MYYPLMTQWRVLLGKHAIIVDVCIVYVLVSKSTTFLDVSYLTGNGRL